MKTAELVKKCQDRMKSIRNKIENKRKSKKMYSEEEVKRILMKTGNYTKISLDVWFEQFKKK